MLLLTSNVLFRMAIMAFMIEPKDAPVDRDRCIRMALVHDVAEGQFQVASE
jgi:5'-deoxynucleotidase YfbR-like HD superfamily hydrolase